MAKKEEKSKEEQLDLIDVQPKNAKKILRAAKSYKEAQRARLTALGEEVKQKQRVLGLIKEAKLTPLEDGTIKFQLDGIQISVKPRDGLLKVKYDDEEEES